MKTSVSVSAVMVWSSPWQKRMWLGALLAFMLNEIHFSSFWGCSFRVKLWLWVAAVCVWTFLRTWVGNNFRVSSGCGRCRLIWRWHLTFLWRRWLSSWFEGYHSLTIEFPAVEFAFGFHGWVDISEDDEGLSSHSNITFGDDLDQGELTSIIYPYY